MQLEEVYDVINDQRDKIGTSTWTEVHTRGLLHQVVHGILFSDNSCTKTLLKKRAKINPQELGKYEIAVAGHVLSGETPKQTIKQETREELFGNKSLPKNIFIEKITTYLNQDIPNNKEIAHLFKIIHPGPFTIQTSEADEIIWIDWKIFLRDLKNNPNMYSQYSINAVNIYLKNIYK